MPEIVIGGLVVPGVVAAVVAGLWSFATQRSLRALEGRLAREGDAFRLGQSPRVKAAVAVRNPELAREEKAALRDEALALLASARSRRAAAAAALRRMIGEPLGG
jgi:hypothetical protein